MQPSLQGAAGASVAHYSPPRERHRSLRVPLRTDRLAKARQELSESRTHVYVDLRYPMRRPTLLILTVIFVLTFLSKIMIFYVVPKLFYSFLT